MILMLSKGVCVLFKKELSCFLCFLDHFDILIPDVMHGKCIPMFNADLSAPVKHEHQDSTVLDAWLTYVTSDSLTASKCI
jgi:hypothetical protein